MTGDARGSHQLRVAMPNPVIKWAKRNTHSDPGLLGLVQLLHPVPKVNVTEALPCLKKKVSFFTLGISCFQNVGSHSSTIHSVSAPRDPI